jgi:hypothetical protein
VLRRAPLFALDSVILSPHSAGLSKEAAIRMAISTAKNVPAGVDGKLDPLDGRQPRGTVRADRTSSRLQPEARALANLAHLASERLLSAFEQNSARIANEDGS